MMVRPRQNFLEIKHVDNAGCLSQSSGNVFDDYKVMESAEEWQR